MKKKAVIFDMDGVIIDSEPIAVVAEEEVFAKHKVPIKKSDWDNFRGKRSREIFAYVIDKYKMEHLSIPELSQDRRNFYGKHFVEKARLFEGFIDLAEYLFPNYKIALTTSSGKHYQELTFDRFDLHKYFSTIVTGDMVEHGKPHPEPYLLTLSKLGLEGDECIVIEDSDNGVTSANAAGIETIAITHTFGPDKLSHADFIVHNLKDIKKFL
jgi:beta-phosphoglucomutase-like phosphatase (HAD superfamily)